MYTIVETPVFQRYAAEVWNEAELMEFKLWLAGNPLCGDVIPGAGGLRKVRWSRAGILPTSPTVVARASRSVATTKSVPGWSGTL